MGTVSRLTVFRKKVCLQIENLKSDYGKPSNFTKKKKLSNNYWEKTREKTYLAKDYTQGLYKY